MARRPLSASPRVDDAEAVPLRIGQDDEVGVLRVPIPIHPGGTERDEPFHFGGLVGGVARVEVQVHTGILLDGCLADVEGQMGTVTPGRNENCEVVVGFDLALGDVVECLGPEGHRSVEIIDAHHDGPDAQHALILAALDARGLNGTGQPRRGGRETRTASVRSRSTASFIIDRPGLQGRRWPLATRAPGEPKGGRVPLGMWLRVWGDAQIFEPDGDLDAARVQLAPSDADSGFTFLGAS